MLMHQLLADAAARRPDRACIHWVDRDRGLDYAAAAAAMERAAGALAECGLRPGDRVTIFAHNGLDYLNVMFGAWRLGAIAALVNVRYADDLAYYLADHSPTAVVYTHDMHGPVTTAVAQVGGVRAIICMDGPQEGALSLPDLMAAALPAPADPGDATAVAHLSYTSGTTGRPKGACLRHEPTVRAARCIGERLQITASDVSFGPTALSSSYQLVANLLPQLAVGASINVMGRWTAQAGLAALIARKATVLVANPPVLTDLLEASQRHGSPPPALRMGLSGGGPVPPMLKAAWRSVLGLPLVESYGQSELGGFVALGFPRHDYGDNHGDGDGDAAIRRIGPALPDKEVRIVGQDGARLPAGSVGEIVIAGGCMAGYWNRPDKTAEAVRDGWLWTGDIGAMDADGWITMRGRRSELLQVGGATWYPRDVEEALVALPEIDAAAIVGVPDPALGQRPVAFVQSVGPRDPAAIRAALAGRIDLDLAALQIVTLSALPMTPTGKIAKADLAMQAKEMARQADTPG